MKETLPEYIPPKVAKVLENLLEELVKWNPKKVILFGSLARGDFGKHFDIDLAVELNLLFRQKRKLKDKLDQLAGIYTVDLVFLNEVEKEFKEKLLKEGVSLYEKK